jgi:hypothetical protein|tara:strand:- start:706 stop:1083 length:378 start_codon:yes stop_codon:yes gene_type:complete
MSVKSESKTESELHDCRCNSCLTRDKIYADIEKMREDYNIIYHYNRSYYLDNPHVNLTQYNYIASCVSENYLIDSLNNCKYCCVCKMKQEKTLTSSYDKDAWANDSCSCSYIRRVLCKSLNEYYD